MTQPDPGNPPQTFTFQYSNISTFDGVSEGREFSRDSSNPDGLYIEPNLQGIYDVDQNGPLGSIDPDGVPGTGGASMGDRFILWLEIVVNAPTTVTVELRDGEENLLLQTVIPATAVAQVLYHSTHFRVPQGAVLVIRGIVGNTGGRVRVRSALEPDDCCDDANGGNGDDTVGVARQEFPLGDAAFIANQDDEMHFSWFDADLTAGLPTIVNSLIPRRDGTAHGAVFVQRNDLNADLVGDFRVYVNGVEQFVQPAVIPDAVVTDIPFTVPATFNASDFVRFTFTPTQDGGAQNPFSIVGTFDVEWAQ